MSTILIIEDDELINNGINFSLCKEGYNVISAYTLEEGKMQLEKEHIDLLLLDINLPDGNGFEFVKNNKLNTKIVFLTANDTEEDMVKGYEMGCEDYIPKPFSIKVLKHKINIILKRSSSNIKNIFTYKDLSINYDTMTVFMNNDKINLTATEYKFLELLAKNNGHVVSKEILLQKIWDIKGNYVDDNALSVNVRRIRKKIEKDPKNPEYIVNVFGVGYILGNS